MGRLWASCIFLLIAAGGASADSARITWEWYNAAEIHQGREAQGPGEQRLAAHYFRLAAEKGNATAAYKLGEIYENGWGVSPDPIQAFAWYMQAAARGDRYGQLKVGWCYQKGIAVQPDQKIAAIWYRIAAENGNIWGYHMLGFMLADGDGVVKDVALARRYFEMSLPKTRDHWAKWKLAHLIEEQEPARAKALLKEAAAAGNTQAAEELKQMP
ncbi:tetratricopeptide repeat protein [Neorhizobium sp. NCHU2750]|uniref:tetratricopeptide repeat protein n=1 Tax=Neorhizobium sp. NCHU2750 TaxID=1825976 RepID=UPI000E756905|nr:hypothetical protein NCHU2750_38330 [Neorhizobium sp. NCHU2750]